MKQVGHDFTGTTAGGYTYRFNVCGGTVKVCNRQQAPASKWRGTKCNNLGDMQTQEITLIDEHDANKGIRLAYRDGDICKKQVSGQMEIGSREVTYDATAGSCENASPAIGATLADAIVLSSDIFYLRIFFAESPCVGDREFPSTLPGTTRWCACRSGVWPWRRLRCRRRLCRQCRRFGLRLCLWCWCCCWFGPCRLHLVKALLPLPVHLPCRFALFCC